MACLPNHFHELLAEERRQTAHQALAGPGAGRGRRGRRELSKLALLYAYALRHPAPQRDSVLRNVARQVLDHGPAYVLSRSSREAALFVSWGQRVFVEVQRALQQIRFQRGGRGGELVATWRFCFPVADLVLNRLHRRMRDRTLVLIDGPRKYVHDGCGVRMEPSGRRAAGWAGQRTVSFSPPLQTPPVHYRQPRSPLGLAG